MLAAGNVDQQAGFGSAKAYGETQYAGLSSHVYNIVVGGFDEAGDHAWFARGGESLTCVAQAVDVIVPRHDGSRGQFLLHGTSFSTPQVASAVAQMLEANPDLGARNVREILALSSRMGPYAEGTDIDQPEWEFERNGAATWNGGGLKFSSEFGFGALDALAATRLAETWQTQRTWGDVTTVAKAVSKPALVDRGVMVGQTTVSQALDVDAVELDLKFTHGSWRDLTITVVSPSGTESVVFEGGAVDWSKWDNRDRSVGTLDWSFTSNRFWGEDARGTWQVKIADGAADGRKLSALTEFELRLHGDAPAERQYVYTDDFSEVVEGAATLGWSAGVDTLNAAAVTSASMLDLRPGRASIIDGVSVAVAADCVVENAAGGDGADTLNGQDLANLLLGGRGADTVYGNGGADRIEGGDGNDRVWGGDGNDRIEGGAGADALDGGASDDVMDGGADADVVYGRDGADQVGGGAGNDTLAGQLGDDRLDGGDGIDILAGDAGADQLTGGLGADLFVLTFEDLGTVDRILDMATAEDRIDLAGVWDGRGLSGSRSAWVRLTDVTGGCVVAVDADGPGSGRFTDLVQVDGVGRDQLLDSLVLS